MRRLRELFSDVLVATGAAIVVFSIGLVMLILITAVPVGNPYIGLFAFIFLPALVVTGTAIFVFGVVLRRREKAEGRRRFSLRGWVSSLVRTDFTEPRQRRRLSFFLAAGVVEMVFLSLGGFRMAEFMDTPEFCGQVCHKVMKAEYTVYHESPHARVRCVDCHIGEGAPWLVRSKVSGTVQLFRTVLNVYEHPIPSPVENLRPARETCEVCHWPAKFTGDLYRTIYSYKADEANTEQVRRMVFKVGGGGKGHRGIHWHISARVWYLPMDSKRQEIGWIGVEEEGEPMTVYFDPPKAQEITAERIEREKRLMDCVDCHSRATHIFRSPEELIDQALHQGKVDSSLPSIKKKGLEALVPVNPSLQEADNKIASIAQFYRSGYPEVYAQKLESLASSLEELRQIARLTTFPEQGVTWETHINNIGHTKGPGCLRCHGKLVNAGIQQKIDAKCTLCHEVAP